VGIYVQEIGAKRPLLSINADRLLHPASILKLVTTYAALERLTPAYRWPTEVYATAKPVNGILDGDLVIKGYGDPWMTMENFWRLLREVRSRGVRDIHGDLVLDRSYFAPDTFDPAGFDDRPTRPYNTGPDALLVNFKAVRLAFIPDPDTRSVRIIMEPPLPEVKVTNHLVLDDAPCGNWHSRLKLEASGDSAGAALVFKGRFSRRCGELTRYYSVLGHPQYVSSLFRLLWQELGGSITGTLREGEAAAGASVVASVESPSLAEVVRDINKYSNNVMARQLFLTVGAVEEGAPATTEKAAHAVHHWLAKKGISAPGLVIENGSGLSRNERISARTLGQLLLAAYASPVMPEFIASLPLVAVDGTMKRRLHGAAVAGQAHIKTGLLRGVRSIAGYVHDARGHRVAVVFIVNHAHYGAAQRAQDALLNWVYSRGTR
jgi:D-alanyl-D-alanine carboxypeptidase/D-alanyl-D-alanine-endopeptidase (penicillin-binding protein 4)